VELAGEHPVAADRDCLLDPDDVGGVLLQRALLSVHPGATDEVVTARLKGRMDRQRRLLRDDGPTVALLVELSALYRAVGSAESMAEQCAYLAEAAKRRSPRAYRRSGLLGSTA
jgi:uncharacterized protein DUF5753